MSIFIENLSVCRIKKLRKLSNCELSPIQFCDSQQHRPPCSLLPSFKKQTTLLHVTKTTDKFLSLPKYSCFPGSASERETWNCSRDTDSGKERERCKRPTLVSLRLRPGACYATSWTIISSYDDWPRDVAKSYASLERTGIHTVVRISRFVGDLGRSEGNPQRRHFGPATRVRPFAALPRRQPAIQQRCRLWRHVKRFHSRFLCFGKGNGCAVNIWPWRCLLAHFNEWFFFLLKCV